MDAPSRQDVERQLRLTLSSREFETSPKLSELLYYLVTETLAGNAERLKGYTIGVDVFERQHDFDQAVDAIVRVQMGRLRKLLKSYYQGSGARDPIRIRLAPGRYAPRFELASGEDLSEESLGERFVPAQRFIPPPPSAEEARPGPQRSVPAPAPRRFAVVLGAAVVLLVLSASAAVLLWGGRAFAPREEAVAAQTEIPLVTVSRYRLAGSDPAAGQLAGGLQYDLVNQLAKFPELAVLAIGDAGAGPANAAQPDDARAADFLLGGIVETDASGTIRVTSQLRRQRDGLVIWSDQWVSAPGEDRSVLDLQTLAATSVATKVGQTYGVIPQAMFEEISNGHVRGNGEYACILSTYGYMRYKTQAQHGAVRDCLEAIIARAPRHALAGGLLSWIYGDEERYGFNRRPQAILRALRVAERSVAADAHNAVAHEQLAHARFLEGTDDDSARESIETAIALHPNNSEVLADASWILGLLDGSERANELGLRAIAINPGHPAWYWTGPTIHALLLGERTNALKYARLNISDRGPIEVYLMAAALRLNGRGQEADNMLADLETSHPVAKDRARMMAVLRIPPRLETMIYGEDRPA